MTPKEKIAAKYLMLETRYRNCQEHGFDGKPTGKFDISKVDNYHIEDHELSFPIHIWYEVTRHTLDELKDELQIFESLWIDKNGEHIIKQVNKIVNTLNIKTECSKI